MHSIASGWGVLQRLAYRWQHTILLFELVGPYVFIFYFLSFYSLYYSAHTISIIPLYLSHTGPYKSIHKSVPSKALQ